MEDTVEIDSSSSLSESCPSSSSSRDLKEMKIEIPKKAEKIPKNF